MTTFALRVLFVAVAAVAVAGCGANEYLGKPKEPEPNIVPVNYKQEILDTLRQTLDDPTNVRDAAISEPALMPIGREQRLCVVRPGKFARHGETIYWRQGSHRHFLRRAAQPACRGRQGSVRQRRLQAVSGTGESVPLQGMRVASDC